MNFLQQNCRFGFYTQGKAALCKSFKCGDNVSELALIELKKRTSNPK